MAKKRKPFLDRLKAGLEEGIAHARGELTLKTIQIPEAPPENDAKTLLKITASGKGKRRNSASGK